MPHCAVCYGLTIENGKLKANTKKSTKTKTMVLTQEKKNRMELLNAFLHLSSVSALSTQQVYCNASTRGDASNRILCMSTFFFFFWIRLIVWLSEQPFNNYINLDGTDLCFSIEIYYNFAFVAFNNQLRRLLYWWNLFLCEYWGSFLKMFGRSLLNLDKNHVRSVNACDTSWHRTLHRRIRFHDDSGWYDFVDMLGP